MTDREQALDASREGRPRLVLDEAWNVSMSNEHRERLRKLRLRGRTNTSVTDAFQITDAGEA